MPKTPKNEDKLKAELELAVIHAALIFKLRAKKRVNLKRGRSSYSCGSSVCGAFKSAGACSLRA